MHFSKHLLPLLQSNGRVTPRTSGNVIVNNQEPALGDEAISWLTPLDDFNSIQGSYAHLRAASTIICRSELQVRLPEPWRKLSESDLKLQDGTPSLVVPEKLWQNRALTDLINHNSVNHQSKNNQQSITNQ